MMSTIDAVFMRGGTSKALMIHRNAMPADVADWGPPLMAAMGSPDPYGRQLNGMGGGVSSVSKACIVQPSERDDADVDYSFVQVVVNGARVDMSGNCGNMLSAVAPFAVDEKLITPPDGETVVRVYNTNTKKIIHATFAVADGRSVYAGDLAIPGVSGKGAPIRLDFIEPGGASTGKLLPTGAVRQTLDVPGLGAFDVSMVDAANACVFIAAEAIGLSGTELPTEIESVPGLLGRLAQIRIAASVAMGIGRDAEHAATVIHVPFVCIISAPQDAIDMSGQAHRADEMDLTARVISNGVPHQALPLTATLCTAVAAKLPGSLVAETVRTGGDGTLRVGMPSGILTADASVECHDGTWFAKRGSFFRTARPLMKGTVFVHA